MPAALRTTSTPPVLGFGMVEQRGDLPSSATSARHAVAPPAARTVATVSSARSGFPA